MRRFASGKYALAVCDRCGLDKKYSELTSQFCKHRKTALRVCQGCLDEPNPQEFLAETVRAHGPDPEALKDPRPDTFDRTVRKLNWIDRLTLGAAVSDPDPDHSTYHNVYGENL